MSEIKKIRGQVRQIVKEILPDVLTEQIIAEIKKHIDARLDAIDQRQKDMTSYIIRNSAGPKK